MFGPPPPDAKGEKKTLLPRGSFLFVGGDTAYHVANYSSLYERFQTPFRWAFASVRQFMAEHYELKDVERRRFLKETVNKPIKDERGFDPEWDGMLSDSLAQEPPALRDTGPPRPLFGIPANHDYYDGLEGFNRLFRRPPFADVKENQNSPIADHLPLKIPTFRREQEASYTALRLPFGWRFLGIDSENEKLGFRQRVFFKQLLEKNKPEKLIITTPEPTTVFGRKCDPKDKTATYLADITEPLGLGQPFLNDGVISRNGGGGSAPPAPPGEFCRLDLSGDVHHYARYWGPDDRNLGKKYSSENYASLVAGGGGAFFDSTETLIGKTETDRGWVRGEVPPQSVFPGEDESRRAVSDRIFDLTNIKKGGYVQIIGAVVAGIIFFAVTFSEAIPDFFRQLGEKLKPGVSWLPYSFADAPRADAAAQTVLGPIGLTAGLLLLVVVLFAAAAMRFLHGLVASLKEAKVSGNLEKRLVARGRIRELWTAALASLSAAAVYGSFVLYVLSKIVQEAAHCQIIFYTLGFALANAICIYWLQKTIGPAAAGGAAAESRRKKVEAVVTLSLVLTCAYVGALAYVFRKHLDFSGDTNLFSVFRDPKRVLGSLHPFGLSILLVLHFVGVAMLVAFSVDYTNWLPQRFKHLRRLGEKDHWFSLLPFLGEPVFKRFSGLMHKSRGLINRTWSYLEKNSIEYYPVWLINAFAAALLIASLYLFGNRPLVDAGTEMLFILVVAGCLLGLFAFAVGTGASYHRGWRKFLVFGGVGFWHAVLQLLTPVLLAKSGTWTAPAGAVLLSVATNGFAGVAWVSNFVFGKRRFKKFFSWRLGALAMRKLSPARLFLSWLLYGAIVLSLPFFIPLFIPRLVASLPERWVDRLHLDLSAGELLALFIVRLGEFVSWFGVYDSGEVGRGAAAAIAPLCGLLIAVYLGYRMSRVWLSWYLAVSLAFNGHNNEAGGAARIEGFKHILRIKVEEKKLTVYVIGFEEPHTELYKLKPKLVDKFVLETKPIK